MEEERRAELRTLQRNHQAALLAKQEDAEMNKAMLQSLRETQPGTPPGQAYPSYRTRRHPRNQ